jgi:hypothetical protein
VKLSIDSWSDPPMVSTTAGLPGFQKCGPASAFALGPSATREDRAANSARQAKATASRSPSTCHGHLGQTRGATQRPRTARARQKANGKSEKPRSRLRAGARRPCHFGPHSFRLRVRALRHARRQSCELRSPSQGDSFAVALQRSAGTTRGFPRNGPPG